ncbi:hypothetical protein [Cohnella hongkongensis]|uniref:Uncharacterized protein n=1 Tax=Cohnella hongkongensis TaxID=178337 RepID=A0ABV9FMJ0_9BACL
MIELVDRLEDVIENIKQFNIDLGKCETLQKRLSNFRVWYYIESINHFGPSKFIGFKNMNCERYIIETAKKVVINGKRQNAIRGIETEKTLNNLFKNKIELISSVDRRYEELQTRLIKLLNKHRKKLNSGAKIYILPS